MNPMMSIAACVCAVGVGLGMGAWQPIKESPHDSKIQPPKTKQAPAEAAADDPFVKAATPTQKHSALKALEGVWDASIQLWNASPSPLPTKGVLTCKLDLGGRFLRMDFTGIIDGVETTGSGFWGYNLTDNRYERVWAGTDSCALSSTMGHADASGRSFTMLGDFTDPETGKKTRRKELTRLAGDFTFITDYLITVDGVESRVMTITYKKRIGGKAP